MDSENSNQANYTWELEYCLQIITALEYIVRVLEEYPSRYPGLITDITWLVQGRPCRVDGKDVFINGLEGQIEELYNTLKALELEVQYEMGGEEGELQSPDEG